MSLHPQYARPRNLEQAAELLAGLGTGTMIIAGGQELLPSINYGRLELEVIVDVAGLSELRGIDVVDDELCIGALTVHRDIQQSEVVARAAPMLAYAATQVGGGWQVQNRGTIGGNIVSMHPLYDIIPPLLALGANIEIRDSNGLRCEKLAMLINQTSHGLGMTAIVTRVIIPAMTGQTGWAYEKLKATHGAYGSANAAAVVSLTSDGKLDSVELAVGGASDKPVLMEGLLSGLQGQDPDAEMAGKVERAATKAIVQPLDDHQGPADYRRAMAGVMARRAFLNAADNARAQMER